MVGDCCEVARRMKYVSGEHEGCFDVLRMTIAEILSRLLLGRELMIPHDRSAPGMINNRAIVSLAESR